MPILVQWATECFFVGYHVLTNLLHLFLFHSSFPLFLLIENIFRSSSSANLKGTSGLVIYFFLVATTDYDNVNDGGDEGGGDGDRSVAVFKKYFFLIPCFCGNHLHFN